MNDKQISTVRRMINQAEKTPGRVKGHTVHALPSGKNILLTIYLRTFQFHHIVIGPRGGIKQNKIYTV